MTDRFPGIREQDAICRLLDADPELGEDLSPENFHQARRQLVVPTFSASKRADAKIDDRLRESSFGLLLTDGYIIATVHLAGRKASEILGPGDLLQPGVTVGFGALTTVTRRALRESSLAILDHDFAHSVGRWPSITRRIQERAAQRAGRLSVMRALLFQPRIEIRVALLLDHLSQRWGRMTTEGLRLPVPLTHDILSDLVGAARPSVSKAVARLGADGVLRREGKGWRILLSSDELERYIAQRAARPAELADASRVHAAV